MILRLLRELSGPDTTFGVMMIDEKIECWTLENTHKIIPVGVYPLSKYNSPRNKMEVPLLGGVKDREMIEIHPANFFNELEGCIAVGTSISRPMLMNSRAAFGILMSKLVFDDKLAIEIVDL